MASTPPPTRANFVDVHVGQRVRVLRKLRRVTQAQLGEALSLTFQQVQKYERGTNRISASVLYEIAETLDVGVAYFFEGLETGRTGDKRGGHPDQSIIDQLYDAPGGRDLAEAFSAIRNPHIQRSLVALVKVLAANDPGVEDT